MEGGHSRGEDGLSRGGWRDGLGGYHKRRDSTAKGPNIQPSTVKPMGAICVCSTEIITVSHERKALADFDHMVS